jgi:NAD(P)-dependent dehydrogenase (short-subunit alcohol dehydrogenase family)
MGQFPFTSDEWSSCIKVLKALMSDPLNNPDNLQFKTLITSIHKKARKSIRNEEKKIKDREDSAKIKESIIIKKALSNATLYAHETTEKKDYKELNSEEICYSCRKNYNLLHFFYSRLCPDCAEVNYRFREIETDFKNWQILITGGRVKIGYAAALKFLRSGANVIITTRFPALAMEQFTQEKDFEIWKNRLTLYGLDLRNIKEVQLFIQYCQDSFSGLDVLINNAAQTIKYTPDYYVPLNQRENLKLQEYASHQLIPNPTPVAGAVHNNQLLPHIEIADFKSNRFGQPVDLREKNSWNSRLDEINLEELLEVNLINHISPYLLISELKNLMKQNTNRNAYIINVTSSEGQFSYVSKTIHHPNTNMTKAALNMLTRTSAADFIEDRIFMNSVDVGWISTGAHEEKRAMLFNKLIIPPLDSVDGAMRIIHPILETESGNEDLFGKLLKNYIVVDW